MITTPAIAGAIPQRDQHDDTRETAVRGSDGPRAEASSPDWTADRNGPSRPGADTGAVRSPVLSTPRRAVRAWPVLVLAAPAAVAVWSGWVGIGQMTGFGEIRPLPGIWDTLHVDTAVTLPIGVEAYAAFALHAWLTSNPAVSDRTRRFARWSAIAAMILGMSGQVAYHLLNQVGTTRAPWEVTTLVACLPVAVLGMGSALAHLLRSDAALAKLQDADTHHHRCTFKTAEQIQVRHAGERSLVHGQPAPGPSVAMAPSGPFAEPASPPAGRDAGSMNNNSSGPHLGYKGQDRLPARVRRKDTEAAVARVIVAGKPISRRSLRSAGLHGSNTDLGMLARMARANPAQFAPPDGLPMRS